MIVVEETLNKKWYWWPLFPLYPYGKKKTILRELIPDQIWSLEQLQGLYYVCLLYTSPSPRDPKTSRMPSSA